MTSLTAATTPYILFIRCDQAMGRGQEIFRDGFQSGGGSAPEVLRVASSPPRVEDLTHLPPYEPTPEEDARFAARYDLDPAEVDAYTPVKPFRVRLGVGERPYVTRVTLTVARAGRHHQ